MFPLVQFACLSRRPPSQIPNNATTPLARFTPLTVVERDGHVLEGLWRVICPFTEHSSDFNKIKEDDSLSIFSSKGQKANQLS